MEYWQHSSFYPGVTTPGIYKLTAITPCGSFADSVTIAMVDCSCLPMIPSAFSPNGDGLNDNFLIQDKCSLPSFGLYNRFGQQVFYSNDIRHPCDGQYEGQKCDVRVYFYYLKYKKPDGESIGQKGDISLVL